MTDTDSDVIGSGHAYFRMLKGDKSDASLVLEILSEEENLLFERYRHAKKLKDALGCALKKFTPGDIEWYQVYQLIGRINNKNYKLTTDKEDE